MKRRNLPLVVVLAVLVLSLVTFGSAFAKASFTQLPTINPPSTKGFDIGFVDNSTNTYYLADRTNHGIDVINPATGTYLGTMTGAGALAFQFAAPSRALSGPNGVLTDKSHNIWAGDGNSSIKTGTLSSGVTESISTCLDGHAAADCRRADELSYDPIDNIILIANDTPITPTVGGPFLTFISTAPGHHHVLGHFQYPNTQVGMEQSVWDPQTGLFYQAVPGKGIDVFDPHTLARVDSFPLPCTDGPSGLALGPNQKLAAACGDGGYLVQLHNGHIHKVIPEVGGADEAWYNPGDHNFYFARSSKKQVGVVNGDNDHFVTNLTSGPGAHSVAAAASNNHIFVPVNTGVGILVFESGK